MQHKARSKAPRQPQRPATHYSAMSVSPSISQDNLHTRFKELARVLHPDTVPGETLKARRIREDLTVQFSALSYAYAVLKNVHSRAAYDRQLECLGNQCTACKGQGTLSRSISFTRIRLVTCTECEGTGQRVK